MAMMARVSVVFLLEYYLVHGVVCFALGGESTTASPMLGIRTARHVVQQLKVANGGPSGQWTEPDFCPPGTYAIGYYMKLETSTGDQDDTALNGVKLHCSTLDGSQWTGDVTSGIGWWGYWGDESTFSVCRNDTGQHFIKKFALQVEAPVGDGDDTAANYIKFQCADFDGESDEHEMALAPGYGLWGAYGAYSESCRQNSAVCGIRTKIEPSQCGGDDTSLNDVSLYCCDD